MDLVAVTSLKQFFKSLLDEALGATGLDIAEVTEFYLANLLAEFAAADRLFAPEEPGGAEEPLALLYHRAQAAEREERIRILRRLGDVSLYKAGFFAGALRDSVVGQGYTIDMGRAAYIQVAALAAVASPTSTTSWAASSVRWSRCWRASPPLLGEELSVRRAPGLRVVASHRERHAGERAGRRGLLPPGGGLPN
jgi:hypothetical protein